MSTLDKIYQIIAEEGQNEGLSHALADNLADSISRRIGERIGGSEVYIPKTSRLQRRNQVRHIRRAFTGNNARQVCTQFGISKAKLYRIVGR